MNGRKHLSQRLVACVVLLHLAASVRSPCRDKWLQVPSCAGNMADGEMDVAMFSSARPSKRKPSSKQEGVKKVKRTSETPAAATEEQAGGAAEEAQKAPAKTFRQLGLGEHLETTCSSLGMTLPTPVQVRLRTSRAIWLCPRVRLAAFKAASLLQLRK